MTQQNKNCNKGTTLQKHSCHSTDIWTRNMENCYRKKYIRIWNEILEIDSTNCTQKTRYITGRSTSDEWLSGTSKSSLTTVKSYNFQWFCLTTRHQTLAKQHPKHVQRQQTTRKTTKTSIDNIGKWIAAVNDPDGRRLRRRLQLKPSNAQICDRLSQRMAASGVSTNIHKCSLPPSCGVRYQC